VDESPGDFDALSSALENNTRRLEQLQLDFVNWPLEDEDDSTNFFAREALKLPAGQYKVMFPALKVLSLRAISLKNSVEKELAHALNLSPMALNPIINMY
jgi:hypothetical protein